MTNHTAYCTQNQIKQESVIALLQSCITRHIGRQGGREVISNRIGNLRALNRQESAVGELCELDPSQGTGPH